jgi:hypothetical protein
MDISVRNVQRLIYGEIAPLKSIHKSIIADSRQSNISEHDGDIGGTDVQTDETGAGKDHFNGNPIRLRSGENNSNNSTNCSNILSENSKSGISKDLPGIDTSPGSSTNEGPEKHKDVSKGIRLYDELKLANRFKDEEIRYIISILEKEIINTGSKYFITLDSGIGFKKVNNVITLTVNLKQKD